MEKLADIHVSQQKQFFYYQQYSPWLPNPILCAHDILSFGVREFCDCLPFKWLVEGLACFLKVVFFLAPGDWKIVVYPLCVGIVLTLFRKILNYSLFKYVLKAFNLPPGIKCKLDESLWKVLVCLITSCWATYLLFSGEDQYFFNLASHYYEREISDGLYAFFVFEIGFYLHSMYAIVCMETIRKDFYVMASHHFLAYLQLTASYLLGLYIHAPLVIFFMDFGDFLLDLSKLFLYLHEPQDGKSRKGFVMAANTTFCLFAFHFIFFRIYWYPTKVLYSTVVVAMATVPQADYIIFMNMVVVPTFLMQLYWLYYILRLLWKVARKEEIDDSRDYEQSSNNGHVKSHNGTIATKKVE